jgi:hypothetical protein
MSVTLPLRLRILQYIGLHKGQALAPSEIYEALKEEYEGEGQFSPSKMKWHLMCIKAVGLIEGVEPFWDEGNEPTYRFRITQAGIHNLSFLR